MSRTSTASLVLASIIVFTTWGLLETLFQPQINAYIASQLEKTQ
jgi:hypothetical protein